MNTKIRKPPQPLQTYGYIVLWRCTNSCGNLQAFMGPCTRCFSDKFLEEVEHKTSYQNELERKLHHETNTLKVKGKQGKRVFGIHKDKVRSPGAIKTKNF